MDAVQFEMPDGQPPDHDAVGLHDQPARVAGVRAVEDDLEFGVEPRLLALGHGHRVGAGAGLRVAVDGHRGLEFGQGRLRGDGAHTGERITPGVEEGRDVEVDGEGFFQGVDFLDGGP